MSYTITALVPLANNTRNQEDTQNSSQTVQTNHYSHPHQLADNKNTPRFLGILCPTGNHEEPNYHPVLLHGSFILTHPCIPWPRSVNSHGGEFGDWVILVSSAPLSSTKRSNQEKGFIMSRLLHAQDRSSAPWLPSTP